jgi:hypothetical protein
VNSNLERAMAAGIFFLGYVLFEVLSNLIRHQVGALRPASSRGLFCS